ncbi:MAG: gliding motility-associated ABC transporter ATP-binding subunit GldA [Sphingobacteriales bacterium]|nr:MAG: gliding motility-associated ABC transporter ATP-binding subunit GldA [Sphingobacteriales bacterium]
MSIQVQGLTKMFGEQKAVDNMQFEVAPGEVVGFLGPNGAGKSTTMKMITGYLPPTSGRALVSGFDPQVNPLEVRKRVGYLPEANPLYLDMYVREYLQFSGGIHGYKAKEALQRAETMIERTGLTKEAHKKIGMLSKGYKQRVGLAQALLHDPEVLILDEPTSGLDPNQLIDIRNLITSIGKEKTVLLSTHIMQEVQALCSRVIIIRNGQLAADDAIADLQTAQHKPALLLRLEADVDSKLLKGIPTVRNVTLVSPKLWRLEGDDLEAMRRQTMQWALDKDIAITALQADTQSLEEVFRNLTK